MNAQPLLFLGDTRRRAITTRVAAIARRWRQSWAPGVEESFDATCEAPVAGGHKAPVASVATSCWALEVAGERVAVLLLPHATFAWCVQEAGAVSLDVGGTVAADSLAEQLELEVARSLLMELCPIGQREAVSVTRVGSEQIADWSVAARAWTLNLKSGSAARSFSLLVSAARLEMLAPTRAIARSDSLAARHQAVGTNTVTLRAVVGDTAMSVNELAELALDDVLVLDQHLSEPVALVAEKSGAAIAAGNLGRAGARRAVKVAGLPAQRN